MMKIVAVCDVALGYGTPQLPLLAGSLLDHYRSEDAMAYVIEPAQPETPPKHGSFPHLRVLRVTTAEHPHSTVGRIEYVWRAAQLVNELQPAVLVIGCTYCLPVLFRLKQRPRKVIYYSTESIPFYGEFDVEMNRRAAPLLDLVLFPEENRAVLEVRRCGFDGVAKAVLYNTSKRRGDPVPGLPASARNGRFLYAGIISTAQTFADYFLSNKLKGAKVDLFGPMKAASDAEREAYLAGLPGTIRYRGQLPAEQLDELRKTYAYSLVMWNPNNENQLYAAPNKFFEAIGDGVPPIAAPHAQCKMIVERYGCGLLMRDWSLDSFAGAVRYAAEIYGTRDWEEMVANCVRAVEAELTWDAQFDKIRSRV